MCNAPSLGLSNHIYQKTKKESLEKRLQNVHEYTEEEIGNLFSRKKQDLEAIEDRVLSKENNMDLAA